MRQESSYDRDTMNKSALPFTVDEMIRKDSVTGNIFFSQIGDIKSGEGFQNTPKIENRSRYKKDKCKTIWIITYLIFFSVFTQIRQWICHRKEIDRRHGEVIQQDGELSLNIFATKTKIFRKWCYLLKGSNVCVLLTINNFCDSVKIKSFVVS